jgi:hypothetical protein
MTMHRSAASNGAESEATARTDRWQHLVSAAFHLDETVSPERAVHLLDSALEVFPPTIDPVEDFEGYAVRRMLLALRRALTPDGARDGRAT